MAIDGDELIVGASSRDVVAPVQVFSKTPSGFTLGRSGFCRCLQYKGFMDEVSLWNASLSAEDVKIHHAMPPVHWHRSYDSLVAYWAFDEGGLESTDTLPRRWVRTLNRKSRWFHLRIRRTFCGTRV